MKNILFIICILLISTNALSQGLDGDEEVGEPTGFACIWYYNDVLKEDLEFCDNLPGPGITDQMIDECKGDAGAAFLDNIDGCVVISQEGHHSPETCAGCLIAHLKAKYGSWLK